MHVEDKKGPIGLMNKTTNIENKTNTVIPNTDGNNFRKNGNNIGTMGTSNTPNHTDTKNNFKKSPWNRNSMGGNNGSPSLTGSSHGMNQGSGRNGSTKKSPWGGNSNRFGNVDSPSFTGSPNDFNQGSGRRTIGQGRDFYIADKLKEISENLDDFKPKNESRRKFSNQARLWVGNIPLTTAEEELKELFKPYGEFDEFYFDKNKGFMFIRMDFKENAVKALVELKKEKFKGRDLKIRLSPTHGTALRIRNLSPHVTTELLEKVFEVFGEIERAIVFTDERGNSKCEGVVEFCKKPSASMAMRRCQEGCLFMTASLRPIIVDLMPMVNESEGLGETGVNRRETRYYDERQKGPQLPQPGSFEDEYGMKWKKLYESYDAKKKDIENIMKEESQKLDMQMEFARHQHETNMLRQKLREREEANSRIKFEYEQQQSGYGMFGNHTGNCPKYEDEVARQSDYDQHQNGYSNNRNHLDNCPKYEDEVARQSEDNNSYQQNHGNKRSWEDSHYDSLYTEQSGAKRGNFDSRTMNNQGNNFRNTDYQGMGNGGDLRQLISK